MTPRLAIGVAIAAGAILVARAAAVNGSQLDVLRASWGSHVVAVLGHGGSVCGPFDAYAPDGTPLIHVNAGQCVGSTK